MHHPSRILHPECNNPVFYLLKSEEEFLEIILQRDNPKPLGPPRANRKAGAEWGKRIYATPRLGCELPWPLHKCSFYTRSRSRMWSRCCLHISLAWLSGDDAFEWLGDRVKNEELRAGRRLSGRKQLTCRENSAICVLSPAPSPLSSQLALFFFFWGHLCLEKLGFYLDLEETSAPN